MSQGSIKYVYAYMYVYIYICIYIYISVYVCPTLKHLHLKLGPSWRHTFGILTIHDHSKFVGVSTTGVQKQHRS